LQSKEFGDLLLNTSTKVDQPLAEILNLHLTLTLELDWQILKRVQDDDTKEVLDPETSLPAGRQVQDDKNRRRMTLFKNLHP